MNKIFKKRLNNTYLEIPDSIIKVMRLKDGNLLEMWLNERGNLEIKKVEFRRNK